MPLFEVCLARRAARGCADQRSAFPCLRVIVPLGDTPRREPCRCLRFVSPASEPAGDDAGLKAGAPGAQRHAGNGDGSFAPLRGAMPVWRPALHPPLPDKIPGPAGWAMGGTIGGSQPRGSEFPSPFPAPFRHFADPHSPLSSLTSPPATLKSDAASPAVRSPAARDLPRGAAPFVRRHIGPSLTQQTGMLHELGLSSRDELIAETIPGDIRIRHALDLPPALAEGELLEELRAIAGQNRTLRNFIGRGYYGTITPPVILRNILEDPGWYTQYTPYQSEISQGRLEILLNFQTMVADLTGLPVAGASLLDEGTAAAEAMAMCHRSAKRRSVFLADRHLHPQTLAVMETRARAAGIRLEVRDLSDPREEISKDVSGVIVQYPDTRGRIREWRPLVEKAQQAGARTVVATDLLALTLLDPPGSFGADVAVGSTQRFGMPMGGGGPHAAFLATTSAHARRTPGRVVGVSRDSSGRVGFRLALQTREQHIRRDRATSNICTAQVLPALVASAYAAWHGPEGLLRIARRVRSLTLALREGLRATRLLHGFRAGLRHPHGGDRRRRDVADPGRRRSAGHQPGPAGGRGRRRLPRRDRGLRRSRRRPRRLRRGSGGAGRRHPARRRGGRAGAPPEAAAAEHLPRSRGLPRPPLGARDAPLPAQAQGARPLAHHLDDPARLLHHEAERDRRDAAGDLAGVREHPPLRAGRTAGGASPRSPPTSRSSSRR